MTAKEIVQLLAQKHSGDVFVSECKDGPTWFHNHFRMDAWAMKRSWKPICMIGYEVKVSRGDFLQDDKWRAYLPYCHQFYFACPHGLIRTEELPAEAGLLYVNKNGSGLRVMKKSPARSIELPARLLTYILMSRSHIGREIGTSRKEQFEALLADKREYKKLGHWISGRMGEEMKQMREQNRSLQSQINSMESLAQELETMGFTRPFGSNYSQHSQLQKLAGKIPYSLINSVNGTLHKLEDLKQEIEALTAAEARS